MKNCVLPDQCHAADPTQGVKLMGCSSLAAAISWWFKTYGKCPLIADYNVAFFCAACLWPLLRFPSEKLAWPEALCSRFILLKLEISEQANWAFMLV